MPGTTPIRCDQGRTLSYRFSVGTEKPHDVEVSYGRTLRVLRVVIDGRTAYRHSGLLPWAARAARDFKTPGREAHTILVEPPGSCMNPGTGPGRYVIWLDGVPILKIDRG